MHAYMHICCFSKYIEAVFSRVNPFSSTAKRSDAEIMIWEGSKPTSDDEPITSEKADEKGPLSELTYYCLYNTSYCNQEEKV